MSGLRVRPAVVDDAPDIAASHTTTWQAAYEGLLPQQFLDGLDASRRIDGWRRAIGEPAAGEAVLVAERDGTVVGFAAVGPSRDDDAVAGDGEVRAIYVDPRRWGTGAGRALMIAALDALRGAGHTQAILWVLDGNVRGRSFYERGGWVADGAAKDDTIGDTAITEVRYRRPLP